MSSRVVVGLYCEHVAKNHVHCNRYTKISDVRVEQSITDVIDESLWSIVDGEVRCPEHHD